MAKNDDRKRDREIEKRKKQIRAEEIRAEKQRAERVRAESVRMGNSAPEKPRVKPGRLVLLGLILLTAAFQFWKFVKSGKIEKITDPMIQSSGIEISGLKMVDSLTAVKAALGRDTAISISPKDLNNAVKRVRRVPGVISARPAFSFSKVVLIRVKERTPAAFAVFRGTLYFMSADGWLWPFKAGNYWDFPVLSGISCTGVKTGELRVSTKDLKRYRSILETFRSSKEIRPVGLDFRDPDKISVRFNGIEPTIRFGNDPEKRLENMNGILDIIRRDDVEVRRYIDLSYKNVAFIR